MNGAHIMKKSRKIAV